MLSQFTNPVGIVSLTAAGAALGSYAYTNRKIAETESSIEDLKTTVDDMKEYLRKNDIKALSKVTGNIQEIGVGFNILKNELIRLRNESMLHGRLLDEILDSLPDGGKIRNKVDSQIRLHHYQHHQESIQHVPPIQSENPLPVKGSQNEEDEIDEVAALAASRRRTPVSSL